MLGNIENGRKAKIEYEKDEEQEINDF